MSCARIVPGAARVGCQTPVRMPLDPRTQALPGEPDFRVWAPLRGGVFRAVWIAAVLSIGAIWMQDVGAGWLMKNLTGGDPLMVALVQAAASGPGLGLKARGSVTGSRPSLTGTCWPLLIWHIAQFFRIANQLAEVASASRNAIEQIKKGLAEGGVGLRFFANDGM